MDDADTNRRFAESLGADFPILADPDKKVARAFGVLGPLGFAHRWTYYIGADGTVLFVDKAISTKTAGADMAARLEQLGIGKR